MKFIKLEENGHWCFPVAMDSFEFEGFIYVVYDTILNRAYLGKKKFITRKNGCNDREGWKSYSTSSSVVNGLKERSKTGGFLFICLDQYRFSGALAYAETWSLCHVDAPMSDTWYNKRIEGISWKVKEPVTERHKQRLDIVQQLLDGKLKLT